MLEAILPVSRESSSLRSFRCYQEGPYYKILLMVAYFIIGYRLCRFGTKRVAANRVYQEYIADKQHLHMNSTRWVTLTEFVKHLGRSGVARVDETEKGWFIAWIDSSPKALAKAVSFFIYRSSQAFPYLSSNLGSLPEER